MGQSVKQFHRSKVAGAENARLRSRVADLEKRLKAMEDREVASWRNWYLPPQQVPMLFPFAPGVGGPGPRY